MTWAIWLSFLGLVFVFLMTPGASHLLMLGNSAAYGFRRAIATALGDLSANILQMLAAGLGVAVILETQPRLFLAIQWAGVAYMIYLGINMIRGKRKAGPQEKAVSAKALYAQGFISSASNPKAIVFFAALFPQFINPDAPLPHQLAILIATYIAMDGMFLMLYGAFADRIAKRLTGRKLHIISGAFIILAAVLLAAKAANLI